MKTHLLIETKCPIDNVCHFMDKRQLSDQIKTKRIFETVESIDTGTFIPNTLINEKPDVPINVEFDNDEKKKKKESKNMPFTMMLQKRMKNMEVDQEELSAFSKIYEENLFRKLSLANNLVAVNSLFLFTKTNKFRKKIWDLTRSIAWEWVLRIMLLLDVFSLGLEDFSYRIHPEIRDSFRNNLEYYLETSCNIFFTIEAMLRILAQGLILEKGTYLRSKWNCLNTIIIIASFIGTNSYYSFYVIDEVASLIRITRFLRFTTSFESLRGYIIAYSKTLTSIGGVLFNLCFFMYFYAVLGLHLFKGLLESRCRLSESPPTNITAPWEASSDYPYLCNSFNNKCPTNTYCRNPFDYGMDSVPHESEISSLNYGQANFDNLLIAFLTNLNFVSFTGWSSVNDIFWKAVEPSVVVIYGVTMKVFLGTVLKNMLIAGVYQGIVANQSGIKNYAGKKPPQKGLSELKTLIKLAAQKQKKLKEKGNQTANDNDNNIVGSFTNLEDSESPIRNGNSSTREIPNNLNKKTKGFFIFKLIILRKYSKKLLSSWYFLPIFTVIWLFNIAVFFMENYNSRGNYPDLLSYADKIITLFFVCEVILRALTFNYKRFLEDIVFYVDLIIIFLCFTEMIMSIYQLDYTSNCIKYLKVLRIFIIFDHIANFKALTTLYKETILTLYRIGVFLITVFIFILVISLLGRELFAYKARFDINDHKDMLHGDSPRINFDTMFNSIIATVIIFLNEEWHAIMYDYMRGFSPFSGFFFAIVLMIGDLFCMKIFMALFINNLLKSQKIKAFFGLKTVWSQAVKKIKIKLNRTPNQIRAIVNQAKKNRDSIFNKGANTVIIGQEEVKRNLGDSENGNSKNTSLASKIENGLPQKPEVRKSPDSLLSLGAKTVQRTASGANEFQKYISKNISKFFTEKLTRKYSKLGNKSMGILSLESNFRRKIFNLVTNTLYEKFILFTILVSCTLLIIRNPLENPESEFNNGLFVTDIIMLFLYFFEIFLNCIAYGFVLNGKYSFLRNKIHFFDFILFIITIFGTIDAKYVLIRGIYIKVFRSFRLFKIIKFHQGLKILTTTLLNSLNQLGYLFLFYMIPFTIFSLITNNVFQGGFHYCVGLDKEFTMHNIKLRNECLDWGGNWILKDYHYENVFNSMSTLYQIATTENWISIMFLSYDYVGTGYEPKKNNHTYWSVFYIFYFFICNVVMANILLGIFVEKFLIEKEKKSAYKEYTEEQKEWAEIKHTIYSLNPLKTPSEPRNLIRKYLWRMIFSEIFQWIDFLSSLMNAVAISLFWHRQPALMASILKHLNYGFVCIFMIQIHMRLISQGPQGFFIHKLWNTSEYITILLPFIVLTLRLFSVLEETRTINGVINGLQILKVLPIIRKIPTIKRLLSVIYYMLPQAITISMLLIIVLIIYSLIGVEFFAFLKYYNTVGGEDVNFRSVGRAMHTLIRGATGEGWPVFMSDSTRKMQPNYACKDIVDYEGYVKYGLEGCGNSIGYLYWFSFTVIITWLILNLFFALILSTIDEYQNLAEKSVNRYMLKDIVHLWQKFDPQGLGFISYKDFWVFSSQVIEKFDLEGEELRDLNNKKHFLRALQLPVYIFKEKTIYGYKFHESVTNLCKLLVIIKYGVFDLEPTKIFKKEQTTNQKEKKERGLYFETGMSSADLACFVTLRKFLRFWKSRKSKKEFDFSKIGPVLKKNKYKARQTLFGEKLAIRNY